MKECSADLISKGMKVAVIVSRFNSFLTDQLVKGALDAFVRHGGDEKCGRKSHSIVFITGAGGLL